MVQSVAERLVRLALATAHIESLQNQFGFNSKQVLNEAINLKVEQTKANCSEFFFLMGDLGLGLLSLQQLLPTFWVMEW
jgi:hypothetical protein